MRVVRTSQHGAEIIKTSGRGAERVVSREPRVCMFESRLSSRVNAADKSANCGQESGPDCAHQGFSGNTCWPANP